MGDISKNFSFYELERSETAERLGIDNTIKTDGVRKALVALVTEVLQPLRDAVGNPLHLNSGYRCPELNKAVGGVPTSQHVRGEAADVATSDPLGLARLAKSIGLPFDQMIIYPNFVHFSHKFNGAQRKQILYNRRYSGEKL